MGVILSIIVPIYNVEDYLRKCVNSLLDQDILENDYEIILIDDGSTDSSGIIADCIASDHANVKVIHQVNGGLGSARNTGIHNARGIFLQFVDSDDYIEPNVLGMLISEMVEKDLDVLRFNYRNVDEHYEEFEPNKVSRPFMDYSGMVSPGIDFLENRLGYACYACQFIIKTSLLRDSELYFQQNVFYEDTEWTPRLLARAGRASSINAVIYNYLCRHGSITNSPEKRARLIKDQLILIDNLLEQKKSLPSLQWFSGMISNISISILQQASRLPYNEMLRQIANLRMKGIRPLSYYHLTDTALKKARMINFSPLVFCLFYRLKYS